MAKGEVYRDMTKPMVAKDVTTGGAVVTLNGDEGAFIVLQLGEQSADELARKLKIAGFGVQHDGADH